MASEYIDPYAEGLAKLDELLRQGQSLESIIEQTAKDLKSPEQAAKYLVMRVRDLMASELIPLVGSNVVNDYGWRRDLLAALAEHFTIAAQGPTNPDRPGVLKPVD